MTPNLQRTLARERRVKTISVVAILLIAVVVLFAVKNLLISFVLAFVINYIFSPLVDFLERKGFSRQAAVVVPFAMAGLCLVIAALVIFPLLNEQLALLESRLPKYQSDLISLISGTEHRFRSIFKHYKFDLPTAINAWVADRTTELSEGLPSAIGGSLTVLMLSPFFAFFMLKDGRTISQALLSVVPNHLFELALTLQYQLNEQMGGFIRARLFESAIVGFVVAAGLQIVDFPYAPLLGLFAGLANVIPYVGPIIGAVPALLIAIVSRDAMVASTLGLTLASVSLIFFIAQLIDVVFIIPMVVARIVNLHPVSVIIVITIGAQLMGILGMIISIPIASSLKLIFQTFYQHLIEFRS